MSYKKYEIRGLGVLLDGLIVSVDSNQDIDDNGCLEIKRIRQVNKLFDTFSYPVLSGLHIDVDKLIEYSVIDMELETDNPFGDFISEGKIERDGISVFWARHSNAMVVTVKNLDKTKYSKNIFRKADIERVRYLLKKVSDDSYDMTDITFDLCDAAGDDE